MSSWRLGRKVPLNVYDGDRPVCQCHSEEDAERIVAAVNAHAALEQAQKTIRTIALVMKRHRPPEVNPECWDEMSDKQRLEVVGEISRLWYERVGKYWTDTEWVEYLRKEPAKP